MRTGMTSTGFAYKYDETRLDDMRFVDILTVVLDPAAPQFDKISGVSRLIGMLIGEEQKKALYAHIGQSYEGRVPRAELEKALEEIMGSAGERDSKN